jgi:hypothetical protein
MSYLTVDKKGNEILFKFEPIKINNRWFRSMEDLNDEVYLMRGTIKKLTGNSITVDNEPIQINK